MDRMLVIRTTDPETTRVVNAEDFDVDGVLLIPLHARWEVLPTALTAGLRREPPRPIGAVVAAACSCSRRESVDTAPEHLPRYTYSVSANAWYRLADTDHAHLWEDFLAVTLLLPGVA